MTVLSLIFTPCVFGAGFFDRPKILKQTLVCAEYTQAEACGYHI
jgi:hypothetical protein